MRISGRESGNPLLSLVRASLCGVSVATSGSSVGRREPANRPQTERVPLITRFSWGCALQVRDEAEAKDLRLMRVWHTQHYCVVGGARCAELTRGSLRVCREWIAGYLGLDGEYKLVPLPPAVALGDGPVF